MPKCKLLGASENRELGFHRREDYERKEETFPPCWMEQRTHESRAAAQKGLVLIQQDRKPDLCSTAKSYSFHTKLLCFNERVSPHISYSLKATAVV